MTLLKKIKDLEMKIIEGGKVLEGSIGENICLPDSSKGFFETGKITHFYSRILRFRRCN